MKDKQDEKLAQTMGHRVRLLRVSRKLTQEEFGEKLGYSNKHISKIESGRGLITFEFVVKICRVFAINIEYFDPDIPDPVVGKVRVDKLL